jgi:hypothetical protein
MVFPELLCRIFSRDTFQDFGAAGVFVYEACFPLSTLCLIFAVGACGGDMEGKRTSNVIYVLINYYIHPVLGIFMRCYVGDRECFRHFCLVFLFPFLYPFSFSFSFNRLLCDRKLIERSVATNAEARTQICENADTKPID